MPRKKHTKCSTEGCIGIRANRKGHAVKCPACYRLSRRSNNSKHRYGTKDVTFAPGIDKFRSKAPPR